MSTDNLTTPQPTQQVQSTQPTPPPTETVTEAPVNVSPTTPNPFLGQEENSPTPVTPPIVPMESPAPTAAENIPPPVSPTEVPLSTPSRLPSPEGEAEGGQAPLSDSASAPSATSPWAGPPNRRAGEEDLNPPIPSASSSPAHVVPTVSNLKSFLNKALEKIKFRKNAKLEKIMQLAGKKGKITNDQVQKLLRVSDATASRYLLELVKNGRLRRIGVRGGASYEPSNGSNGGN